MKYPDGFGKIQNGPMKVKLRVNNIRSNIKYQTPPIKEFINFKKMSGNEILLNLDNCENMMNSELVGGLLELAKRDKNGEFDWNSHAISQKCLA